MTDSNHLAVEGESDVYFIGPVSRWNWAGFQALFEWLHNRCLIKDWSIDEVISEAETLPIMQRVINLCPRLDIPGMMGFSILSITPEERKALFFGDEDTEAKLMTLHRYEPLPTQSWRSDDDRAPIPSTDDAEMDLLASLSSVFDPRSALKLLETLNARQVDRLLWEMAEIQRDPTERDQEDLAEDFIAWKEENNETYRESLGLKFEFPTDCGNPEI